MKREVAAVWQVIFAEYVRFNRAIVTNKRNTPVVCIAFPEFTPAKISASKSGFPREAKETHGAVFGNRPHKSKRSSEKSLHYYIRHRGNERNTKRRQKKWQ